MGLLHVTIQTHLKHKNKKRRTSTTDTVNSSHGQVITDNYEEVIMLKGLKYSMWCDQILPRFSFGGRA
jgi:hypothetical protein